MEIFSSTFASKKIWDAFLVYTFFNSESGQNVKEVGNNSKNARILET